MFRITHQGKEIGDAPTIEGAREIVRLQPPGTYGVDEVRTEPFASGHTSRAWGYLIRHPDGRVEDDPWAP
jgi:hypothetical protein